MTGPRPPRTVIGLAVGAALGVAGAVAQAGTRNPPALCARAPARRAGDTDPVRLALGGTVFQLALLAWTSAVTLMSRSTLGEARLRLAGSLPGRLLDTLRPVLPALPPGPAVAPAVSPALNALATGGDSARATGVRRPVK
ncbi:iron chelate uptake ABC transporter family permease subunit [Streptomyces resistomycificus]|uniref:iron chelate uptake ABC transporter family permease subunit n=1 Tax=Streptomyces resistomycificus TaxID=67356 RepID=UPI00216B4A5A|nr:iron chelate uptake ABC transporter family permease subunit [Streptomyces resistomycificus]